MHYAYLFIAVVAEVVATSALKASEGFSRLGPSIVVVAGYAVAFLFLSLTLRVLPVGVAYAIWSGAGIIFISLAGLFLFGQKIDAWGVVGLAFIIAGVMIVNFLSKTSAH